MFPAARCASSLAALAALGAALLVAGSAGAQQASLVESIPADGAELNEPPSEIVLTFDSELGDANSVQVACEATIRSRRSAGRCSATTPAR